MRAPKDKPDGQAEADLSVPVLVSPLSRQELVRLFRESIEKRYPESARGRNARVRRNDAMAALRRIGAFLAAEAGDEVQVDESTVDAFVGWLRREGAPDSTLRSLRWRFRSLVNGPYAAGRHTEIWDGRDQVGRSVASGTYLFTMQGPDIKQTRRMLLIK